MLTLQYRYRKMTMFLRETAHLINYKRVQRLMQTMGKGAIYPKPNTSQAAVGQQIYPHLLRRLMINRVHQMWATDISYVPMPDGYMYLTAVKHYVVVGLDL